MCMLIDDAEKQFSISQPIKKGEKKMLTLHLSSIQFSSLIIKKVLKGEIKYILYNELLIYS